MEFLTNPTRKHIEQCKAQDDSMEKKSGRPARIHVPLSTDVLPIMKRKSFAKRSRSRNAPVILHDQSMISMMTPPQQTSTWKNDLIKSFFQVDSEERA